MPQNPILSQVRETFSSTDKETWKQCASQELDGKNAEEVLSWNTEDGISFSAYYTSADEKKNILSKNFRITVAHDPYFGSAKWLNVPFISVTSEKSANQTALQHLTNGADGILFQLQEKINLDYLLSGIDWHYCSLFFMVADPHVFVDQLRNYISKNNLSSNLLSGGLFWDTIPNFNKVDLTLGSELKNFVTIKASTPVQEIAEALSLGVEFVEGSKNYSFDFLRSVGFSISLTNSFLETIAKLKALRFLWFQIAHTYGHRSFDVGDLTIHARSEKWIDEKFQPHGNLLKSTSACMAAILGGANSVSLYPEDPANPMMNRIARNVSNLLREESHLDKVADPSAGAYAIDTMTEQFAKEAWKVFQIKQAK